MCEKRAVPRSAVPVKVFVVGSKSSANKRDTGARVEQLFPQKADTSMAPPVTSTVPSFRNVAVCASRPVSMMPDGVKVPIAGSNSSALEEAYPNFSIPPVTSTSPSLINVVVCLARPVSMVPVGVKLSVLGSKSSAVARLSTQLAGAIARPAASYSSGHEHLAIAEQRSCVSTTRGFHGAGRREGPCGWVEELCSCEGIFIEVVLESSRHKYSAVLELRRRVRFPRGFHGARRRRESPASGIEELCSCEGIVVVVEPSRYEHFAVTGREY